MEWALDPRAGRFVNVEDVRFSRLTELSAPTDEPSCLCTECGNPVFIKTIQKKRVDEDVKRIQRLFHYEQTRFFAHYPAKNKRNTDPLGLQDCPLHHGQKNRSFAALVALNAGVQERYRVTDILARTEIRCFNLALFGSLYKKITNDNLSDRQLMDMYDPVAATHQASPLLYSHPYLLPYLVMRMREMATYVGSLGCCDMYISTMGHRYPLYYTADGKRHQGIVPGWLQVTGDAISKDRPLNLPTTLEGAQGLLRIQTPPIIAALARGEQVGPVSPPPVQVPAQIVPKTRKTVAKRVVRTTHKLLLPGFSSLFLQK